MGHRGCVRIVYIGSAADGVLGYKQFNILTCFAPNASHVVRSGIMTYIIALFLIPLVGSIF